MPATFEPLNACASDNSDLQAMVNAAVAAALAINPAPVPVVPTPKNPWSTALDNTIGITQGSALSQAALGTNITSTPAYAAANLPAYNNQGRGILNYALL